MIMLEVLICSSRLSRLFYTGTGVTLDERSHILETHNRLRSQVAQGAVPNQPGAQNMQEMVWDDELAYKAQQWAEQCTFEHDPGRYLSECGLHINR